MNNRIFPKLNNATVHPEGQSLNTTLELPNIDSSSEEELGMRTKMKPAWPDV